MRVGGGFFEEEGLEDKVDGVMPSGFAAVVGGAMGAFLWMGMGGMVVWMGGQDGRVWR